MYELLNVARLSEAIKHLDDKSYNDVIDAVDLLCTSPESPPDGIQWNHLEQPPGSRHLPRWVAYLPHGTVLVYRPYAQGPPPYAGPHVVILDAYPLGAFIGRLDES